MVCKRSENQGQLTILEKELVTGREREELGLPSAKSSSCPLTVLIRATGSRDRRKGRGREVKDCSWGSGGGGGTPPSAQMCGWGQSKSGARSALYGVPWSNNSETTAGGILFFSNQDNISCPESGWPSGAPVKTKPCHLSLRSHIGCPSMKKHWGDGKTLVHFPYHQNGSHRSLLNRVSRWQNTARGEACHQSKALFAAPCSPGAAWHLCGHLPQLSWDINSSTCTPRCLELYVCTAV